MLIILFPAAYYFAIILSFPEGAAGLAIGWALVILALQYFPEYAPKKVEVYPDHLVASYRKGERKVNYREIAIIFWGYDSIGGGLSFVLKDDSQVAIDGLSKYQVEILLEAIGKTRPDLRWGTFQEGILKIRRGIIEDSEHKGQVEKYWKEGFRASFKYEYFFWGRRPKKRIVASCPTS